MPQLFGFLGSVISIYMMIVFLRIILTWFSWMGRSRLHDVLAKVTDPYLNWFRRFPLRIGFIDLSPIVALAVLSFVNRLFMTFAQHQAISIGIILMMIVQMAWGVVSFILIFLIIIFGLRIAAYLARFNMHNPFWRIVEAIYQPVSYKINRMLFKNRIMSFTNSCLISIACLGIVFLGLRFIVLLLSNALAGLPI